MRQQVLSLLLIVLAASLLGEAQQTCTFCSECNPGYYLNSTYADLAYEGLGYQVCQKCPSFCATCNNLNSCTSCPFGFFLGPNNDCSINWPNCRTFDSDTFSCIGCFEGYYANNATGYCEGCPYHCAECISSTICSSCIITLLWSETDETLHYHNYFYLDSNGVCNFVSDPIEGCVQYTSLLGGCNLCFTGYGLLNSSSSCIQCPPNCEVCDSSGMCQQCINSTYLNHTNGRCIYCPDECATCINYTTCLTCSEPFGLDSNGRCSKCIAACQTCDMINDPLNCQQCVGGYAHNYTTKTCDGCSFDMCILCSYGTYQDSTGICLASSENSSSSGQNSTNSSGSNQDSTNSSITNQSSNNTDSSGSNQSSTNSSATDQSSNNINSSGSNQGSTNSSTTNQSSNNTNSSTQNQNSSNSSSSNQNNTNPSTVTITIINAAGTVISSSQLSIQSAAFTVLMFNGTSSVATNQSSPTVGVILLNGTNTVISSQNFNTGSAVSESSSSSNCCCWSSGTNQSATQAAALTSQSSNDFSTSSGIILVSTLAGLQAVWLLFHILSFLRMRGVQKSLKSLSSSNEIAANHNSSSNKFEDDLRNNQQGGHLITIQTDTPIQGQKRFNQQSGLDNPNHVESQNQEEAHRSRKIQENSVKALESHSKVGKQSEIEPQELRELLKNGNLGLEKTNTFSPQEAERDSTNQLLLQKNSRKSDNSELLQVGKQRHQDINRKDLIQGQPKNDESENHRDISDEETDHQRNLSQQKPTRNQEKIVGKLPQLASNNPENMENVSNKLPKRGLAILSQKNLNQINRDEEKEGDRNANSDSDDDDKNTQPRKQYDQKKLAKLPRDELMSEAPQETMNSQEEPQNNRRKVNQKVLSRLKEDKIPEQNDQTTQGTGKVDSNANDSSNEERTNSPLPRKKYSQKIFTKKKSDQPASKASDEEQEVAQKNEIPFRPKLKERALSRTKQDPESAESKESEDDVDDESEEEQNPSPPSTKNYQKKVLKKLPYHPDVHEVDLEDTDNRNDIETNRHWKNLDNEEEENNGNSNQGWFFQKVVDDDAILCIEQSCETSRTDPRLFFSRNEQPALKSN